MDPKDNFIATVARMARDGECLAHGDDCPGLPNTGCELFEMENDDAVMTLNQLIATARQLTPTLASTPTPGPGAVVVTANVEYVGHPDYWSGNGRRWDDDAACVFASYGPDTTWSDLISELVDDGSDMDGKPLFEALSEADLRVAITNCLRGYGYAGYKAEDRCSWAEAWAAEIRANADGANADFDPDYGDVPQIILLIEIEAD